MKKKIIGLLILVMLFAMFGDISVARAEDEYIDIELGKKYSSGRGEKYQFILTEPSKITVKAERVDYNHYWVLYKIDEMTGEAIWITAQSSEYERTISLAEGVYYWKERYPGSSIWLTITDCVASNPDIEEIEFNDSFDEAQEITMGIKYRGDYGGNRDYYKFILDTPGSVYVETWNEGWKYGSEDEFILYWEDEDLNTHDITRIRGYEYGKSNRYRLPSGTYYLELANKDYVNGYYEYQFKVNYESESPEQYETESFVLDDNNEYVNKIITNKEYIGNIQTEDDKDFYTFEVKDNSRVQLTITQPRGTVTGAFNVTLFSMNEDGTITTLDTIKTGSNPVYRGEELILSKGVYFIQIRGMDKEYYYFVGEMEDISFIDYKISVTEEPIKIVKDITLKTSKKSFYSGMTFSLKATLTPKNPTNASVTWSSSDKDIATVDKNGKVTCLRPGKCYIYAKANDGGGAVGKYLLTVTKSPIKTLSKVTVSDGTISPEFDKTVASYTITLPKDISKVTIKWSRSSKYSTVTVDGKSASKITVSVQQGASKTVKVVVKAEDGKMMTYKFTVKREE